jgi:hypothetical protein
MRVTFDSSKNTDNSMALVRSSWNLECWFLRREEKPENPEKNPRGKGENQQTTHHNAAILFFSGKPYTTPKSTRTSMDR